MGNSLQRLIRFFVGSAWGALVDLAVGSLAVWLGASLWGGSCAGFFSAVLLTYVVHSRWTFSVAGNFFSTRLPKFVLSSLFSLAVRLGVLHGLTLLIGVSEFPVTILLLGISIGASFCVNYFLACLFVFIES